MIPIVFWASLLPCDRAMNPAETIWSRRKTWLSRYGLRLRQIHSNASISKKPIPNPTSGLMIRLSTTLTSPGPWIARAPAWAIAEPTRPPTRACEEDEGIPKYQVTKFQNDRAEQGREDHDLRDCRRLDQPGADGRGDGRAGRAPRRSSSTAASRTAVRIGSTPVLTTVATALAASWKPLI